MFDLKKEDIFAEATAYNPNEPRSGIYFLFHKEELVYIGQADDISWRLRAHATEGTKQFDHYTAYDVAADIRSEVEAHYIIEWSPKYNKNVPPNKRRAPFSSIKKLVNDDRNHMIARYIRDKEIQDCKGYYWISDFNDYAQWAESQPD